MKLHTSPLWAFKHTQTFTTNTTLLSVFLLLYCCMSQWFILIQLCLLLLTLRIISQSLIVIAPLLTGTVIIPVWVVHTFCCHKHFTILLWYIFFLGQLLKVHINSVRYNAHNNKISSSDTVYHSVMILDICNMHVSVKLPSSSVAPSPYEQPMRKQSLSWLQPMTVEMTENSPFKYAHYIIETRTSNFIIMGLLK